MADVFISYRNTPDRRALVERLAFVLHAYRIDVWWDYDLAAGNSYRDEIARELAAARVVAPMWCSESILSQWVLSEARLGGAKLIPARFQKVVPPQEFEGTHAADLVGWDGSASDPRLLDFIRRVSERLGRPVQLPVHTQRQLAQMPPVPPLPEVAPVVAATAPVSAADADQRLFDEVEMEATSGAYQFYLDEFPQGAHAPVARFRLKALRDAQAREAAAVRERAEATSTSPRPYGERGRGEGQPLAPSPSQQDSRQPLPLTLGADGSAVAASALSPHAGREIALLERPLPARGERE